MAPCETSSRRRRGRDPSQVSFAPCDAAPALADLPLYRVLHYCHGVLFTESLRPPFRRALHLRSPQGEVDVQGGQGGHVRPRPAHPSAVHSTGTSETCPFWDPRLTCRCPLLRRASASPRATRSRHPTCASTSSPTPPRPPPRTLHTSPSPPAPPRWTLRAALLSRLRPPGPGRSTRRAQSSSPSSSRTSPTGLKGSSLEAGTTRRRDTRS